MSGRIMLVDDDQLTLFSHQRVLTAAGFDVESADDGEAAIAKVDEDFGCIVSDIHMPGMDGLQLLRRVRARDLDVPVILNTGDPSLDTAIRALEYGALRYLTKPVAPAALVDAVQDAVRIHTLAQLKRDALAIVGGYPGLAGDRAGLEATFARALDSLWVAFQPIVCAREPRVFGHEALLRSTDPALPDPGTVIDAAERLGALTLLGRTLRDRAAAAIPDAPADHCIFVNLHPDDLLDENLYDSGAQLSRHALRVVLEITERAPLDGIRDLQERMARLRKLGFRLAVDDFGAGYAGLASFARIQPEIVKIDMSLIRGIDASAVRHRVVARMTELAHELGIQVLAEGIETQAERDTLTSIGCDYLQGFLLARPGQPFPAVSW